MCSLNSVLVDVCMGGLQFYSCAGSCMSLNFFFFPLLTGCVAQEEEEETLPTTDDDLGSSREGSRTDAEAVER